MKKTALIVAVAGMATALQAAPLESVTFTGVNSIGRANDALNEIRTVTFTSTGLVANLTITGSLSANPAVTNTWSSQAMILCTPPGGQPSFLISPYTGRANMTAAVANVPANSFTCPVSLPFAAAGDWSFRFFESSAEGAAGVHDSVWNSVTITLDDAAPTLLAMPVFVDQTIEFIFDNVQARASYQDNASTALDAVTFTPTQSTMVDTVVLSGIATGTALNGLGNTLAINVGNTQYNFTPVTAILTRVLPPGGIRTNFVAANPAGSVSSSKLQWSPLAISNVPAGSPAGSNPALPANSGMWTIECAANLATATQPAFNGVWNKLRVNLVSGQAPATTELVTLVDGATVDKTGTWTGTGQTKWYKFRTGANIISRTNGTALDLGMVGTALTPENDTCMAVYNATGGSVATSFNSGPGLLPQISFGQGIRNSPGDGIPFDGGNPNRSPAAAGSNYRPDLAANSDYYVVVCNGDDATTFQAGLFAVTPSTETNEGNYTVNFRSWLTPNTTPFDVPNAVNLGTLGTAVVHRNATLTNETRFVWYKFTLPTEASDATGKYVNIDTTSSLEPMNDTNIGLYDSTGAFKGSNDDITTWDATNPTGGNSALSFGDGNNGNGRDYTDINPNLPIAFGGDGVLAAGTYYLNVSLCCATYANNRFWVMNDYVTGTGNGDISVNIRNNYGCGPADIGSGGGEPGSDSHLDNNDFIAFITFFFAQDPIADMGVAGGEYGSDGFWDNNDFIAFINHFFEGPLSCQ